MNSILMTEISVFIYIKCCVHSRRIGRYCTVWTQYWWQRSQCLYLLNVVYTAVELDATLLYELNTDDSHFFLESRIFFLKQGFQKVSWNYISNSFNCNLSFWVWLWWIKFLPYSRLHRLPQCKQYTELNTNIELVLVCQ